MNEKAWNWGIGLTYIVCVAAIWIAASFVVQSVVDGGISPFLITYICNSLFVVYIPIVEMGRYLEDSYGSLWLWFGRRGEKESSSSSSSDLEVAGESEEQDVLLHGNHEKGNTSNNSSHGTPSSSPHHLNSQLDAKGRWTRCRVAKVSLLICPFWFFAQLTFNLSLKYTTVTVRISKSSILLLLLPSQFSFF